MKFAMVTAAVILALGISCGDSSPNDETEITDLTAVDTLQALDDSLQLEPDTVSELIEQDIVTPEVPGPVGLWSSTMGEIEFNTDENGHVIGNYPLGTLDGNLSGLTLEYQYIEGSLEGTGYFTFSEDFLSFSGIQDIAGTELVWEGQRM